MWYLFNGFSFLWVLALTILFFGVIFYKYIPRPQFVILCTVLTLSVFILSQFLYASRQTAGINSYENAVDEIQTKDFNLVFLYSNYWIGCKTAKPIVDQVEKELENQVNVIRLDVMTEAGRDFREEFSIRVTPGFVLVNDENKELWQFIGIPNSKTFLERVKKTIKDTDA